MEPLFKSSHEFSSLSLKDLAHARDVFHYHLMQKKNVVATALGLYRIRKEDPWPSEKEPKEDHKNRGKRRTLFNSEIRPYSWPCVYVFVSDWDDETELAKRDPVDVVPKTLYLPDGRSVPVCVIEARKQSLAKDLRIEGLEPARNLLGPGAALVNYDAQGMPRLATAGCVVRDGERYYALTNGHAVGTVGTRICDARTNERIPVGTTADKGLSREDLAKVYPNFAASGQRLLMDIGLVDIEDIRRWKTAIPGIEPIEPVVDLYDNSLTLQLLRMKVVGLGAVSGLVRGEIHGLFYRYKSMGGSEYIADFLIGPRTRNGHERKEDHKENVAFGVHHGDSGTLLLIEHEPDEEDKKKDERAKTTYHPFAILWGKEEFTEGGKKLSQPYGLATSLSTVLDRLDLDFVRDLNEDQTYIWGWVGHYLIGDKLPIAVKQMAEPELQKFVEHNLALLSVTPNADLTNDPKPIVNDPDHPKFVPLADVPDNVWKFTLNSFVVDPDTKKKAAGKGVRPYAEHQNHYCDIDLPFGDEDTFLDYCLADLDERLTPDTWIEYFKSHKDDYARWSHGLGKKPDPISKHYGALPFRVWQLFNAMVDAKDENEFLCAGGVLIHYVGDACQPLHTSYLADGDPESVITGPRGGLHIEGAGSHVAYEDNMVDYGFREEKLAEKIEKEIEAQSGRDSEKIAAIESGQDAAKALMKLFKATHHTLAPRDIVDKWIELGSQGLATKAHKDDAAAAMWKAFGNKTAKCMARGARVLAAIWSGAWAQRKFKFAATAKGDKKAIQGLYEDNDFVESVSLDRYPEILKLP